VTSIDLLDGLVYVLVGCLLASPLLYLLGIAARHAGRALKSFWAAWGEFTRLRRVERKREALHKAWGVK